MTSDEDIIQALNNLGLTTQQAKVYLVLVRREKERVHDISKAAKIDRSNTYQAISQLQELGLIEKILGSPNTYQAVPIKDAISILLKKKEAQYFENKKEAKKIIRLMNKKDTAGTHKEAELKIVKKGKERELKDIIQAHKEAKKALIT